MSGRSSKSAADNRANQMNPNNDAYYSSRGTEGGAGQMSGSTSSYGGSGLTNPSDYQTQAAGDNRANNLNPNNPAYSKSRGG